METNNSSSYPDSNSSSPLSRDLDSDAPPLAADYKVKFMCSYGGKIQPRPHDNSLSYVGGETKILSLHRSSSFSSLLSKLSSLSPSPSFSLKYQLPGEDLDALISVTNDDDLHHLMSEYDRLSRSSPKPARLRIFLFPLTSDHQSLSKESKSDGSWFVDALNSVQYRSPDTSSSPPTPPPPNSDASNPDFLFGFDTALNSNYKEDSVSVSDSVASVQSQMERSRISHSNEMHKSYEDHPNPYANATHIYNPPEKVAAHAVPVNMAGGGGYWPVASAMAGEQQPFYVFQSPAAGVYHQNQNPAVGQVSGAPPGTGQAYYSVQSAYNAPPPVVSSSARQAAAGGVVAEQGYAQVGYDNVGRPVYYTVAGGGLAPPQYQVVTAAGGAVVDGGKAAQTSPV